MTTPATESTAIRIGALAPLTRPGWTDAGRHLLAGLELAVHDLNASGGIAGRPVALMVRDTAADPQQAIAAIEDMARAGVVAVAGEYHSVVARAAAAHAEALGLPFLCSSAVLDALTDLPVDKVARLSPPQSRGWTLFADYLLHAGHRRIAVAIHPNVYWASGVRILRDRLAPQGATVTEHDVRELTPSALRDQLVSDGATALLLLVGATDLAASLVKAIRGDARLSGLKLGAPAGQPEFAGWMDALGRAGAGIPFLRYRHERLSAAGADVERRLHDALAEAPSFVALEGYDTISVIADVLRAHGLDALRTAQAWSRVDTEGTRGRIRFSRMPGVPVWQWAAAPIQVVERDEASPADIRVLRADDERKAMGALA